jgi:hypothetical protein
MHQEIEARLAEVKGCKIQGHFHLVAEKQLEGQH